ncbi:MAG: succinate-semialdehyde dehydrogenase (NADP(+)) [Planctomycetaceae bacterium]|nr:succinate-semialdehyde dehydrogenase (NADP(+)) [Planctomycetaceae bacterium]
MNTRNLIGGTWLEPSPGRGLEVRDPARDHVVAVVPDVGVGETIEAIDAAERALEGWAGTSAGTRASILRRLAVLLDERRDQLAHLITLEQGKPLAESQAEVSYAASFLPVAADAATALSPDFPRVPARSVTVHQRPVGVTAAITPWNFPLAMLAKKSASALAVGCTQIIKPAEQTPLSAIAFVELAREAGIPPGVINLVTGHPEPIGRTLLEDGRVRKLSFTGSTEVGRILMRGAAEELVRLSLELGGHAPFLVFEDADLDRAVSMALTAKFRNGGQTCVCPNRFLVHRNRHDDFVERLAAAATALTSGPGDREGVDLGPLIDDAGLRKVESHVRDAVDRGADLVCGGGRRVVEGFTDRFPEPTVLTSISREMRCWTEETFGPVCPVRAFADDDEAIRLANDSKHGLAAYAVTTDRSRIDRLGRELNAGIIGVNDAIPAVAAVPFGGIGHSGFGREGGRWGLAEYLETITVSEAD